MARILFVTNDAWFFASHRVAIARAVVDAGHEAVVAARTDASVPEIESVGARFVPWAVEPRGQTPWGEFSSVINLAAIIRREKPDILHLITIKPVLYGGALARLLGVPACLYAVSGLGTAFESDHGALGQFVRRALQPVYRFATGHRNAILVFQNRDDEAAVKSRLRSDGLQTRLVRGSGVDMAMYPQVAEPEGTPRVLLTARLLKTKGIDDFVEAARIVRQRGMQARFDIAGGDVAKGHPHAFSALELDRLAAEPSVTLLGQRSDIPELLASSAIVVLPSHREGLPRSLVEAGAASRVVVTTDVPGCRDAIEPGVTGLTVPVRDPEALADAVCTLLLDPERRRQMGEAGRKLVEAHMQVGAIVDQHLAMYAELLGHESCA